MSPRFSLYRERKRIEGDGRQQMINRNSNQNSNQQLLSDSGDMGWTKNTNKKEKEEKTVPISLTRFPFN